MSRRVYRYELGKAIGPGVCPAADPRPGEGVVVHAWTPAAEDVEDAKLRLSDAGGALSVQVFSADGRCYLVTPSLEEAQSALAASRAHRLFEPGVLHAPAADVTSSRSPDAGLPVLSAPPVATGLKARGAQSAADASPVQTKPAVPVKPERKSLLFWLGGWIILILWWRFAVAFFGDAPLFVFLGSIFFVSWYVARALRRRRM